MTFLWYICYTAWVLFPISIYLEGENKPPPLVVTSVFSVHSNTKKHTRAHICLRVCRQQKLFDGSSGNCTHEIIFPNGELNIGFLQVLLQIQGNVIFSFYAEYTMFHRCFFYIIMFLFEILFVYNDNIT